MFIKMRTDRKYVKENPLDPLNMPFVPLSDKYYINMFLDEIIDEISLDEIFVIYLF